MSHGITRHDALALAGTRAWHGLGTVLPGEFTIEEGLRVAGLDWEVDKVPLRILANNPLPPVPGAPPVDPQPLNHYHYDALGGFAALRRRDTGEVFHVVREGYEPAQNRDLAAVLESIPAVARDVRLESAGSLRGGRQVFFLARTGSFGLGRGKEDEVVQYALIASSHDGTLGVLFAGTDVRVVCCNTLTSAVRGGNVVRAKHTRNLRDKLSPDVVRAALARVQSVNNTTREQAHAMSWHQLNTGALRDFFAEVYTASIGMIPTKVVTLADEKALASATRTVAQWLSNFESEESRLGGLQGTAWAAVNAVTRWSDHGRVRIKDTVAARIMPTGSGYAVKSAAWSAAVERSTS